MTRTVRDAGCGTRGTGVHPSRGGPQRRSCPYSIIRANRTHQRSMDTSIPAPLHVAPHPLGAVPKSGGYRKREGRALRDALCESSPCAAALAPRRSSMRTGSSRRTPWRNGPSTALSKGALAACGSHPGRRDGGGDRPGHRRPPARRGLTRYKPCSRMHSCSCGPGSRRGSRRHGRMVLPAPKDTRHSCSR